MTPLQRLRRHAAGLLGRALLLWLALTLGAATAAPLVNPPTLELVCTSAGALTLVAHDGDGAPGMGAAHLNCPMCLPAGAPPPVAPAVLPALPQPPRHTRATAPATRRAAASAPPLPARGPPTA
ncbi:MAG: hypothetical protein R3E52_01655 [Burkholderiaceae bacterium]